MMLMGIPIPLGTSSCVDLALVKSDELAEVAAIVDVDKDHHVPVHFALSCYWSWFF